MSSGQLRFILEMKEKLFDDIFDDLCEKQLKKKNGASLDFYDLINLIDEAIKKKKNRRLDNSEKK